MIIVKIHNGIGNQLFQYAFGRAASLRLGVPFKLETSWFNRASAHRQYGLERFNIAGEIATRQEVDRVLYRDRAQVLRRILLIGNKFKPYYRRNFVREDLSKCDVRLRHVSSDAFVYGFFGSELFFEDAADTIRKDLTVKPAPGPANESVMRDMESCESVCLSVRRGDFLSNPLYDVCPPDYFMRAAALVASKLRNPHFFVFSDDNQWARENMRLAHPTTFVSHNYPDFYQDLRLMTYCKHYVIPNSSFSWWGAWLSRNPDPIVVAPGRWLNQGAVRDPRYADFIADWCGRPHISTSKVIPDRWIKIPN